MYAQNISVPLTTDALGADVVDTENITGRILGVRYTKAAGAAAFTDGVSMTIVGKESGKSILTIAGGSMNASDRWKPVETLDTLAGVEIADAYEHPLIVNEPARITIAGGGNGKAGTVELVVG